MKKYFLYARKSSDSEDRQILSIEAQLVELKEFARKIPEIAIIDEFIETRTAKEPGRPIFNKMMDRIEKGEAEGIVAWHPDRLARNSVDGGRVIYSVDRGLLKYLDFPIYRFDNTSQGKFMLNIIFGQSKYYVDNLSENVKRGLRQKIRRGEWICAAPLGYINNLRTKKIEIDPVNGPKIKKIFELFLTGEYSFAEIRNISISLGLMSRFTGRPLYFSSIQDILRNPLYCGLMKIKDEIHEATHEPIISKEDFYKTQEMFKGRQRKAQPVKHIFAYTGLIKCPICGCMISAEIQKGFRYYRCTKKRGSCNAGYIREEELTSQINKVFKKMFVSNCLHSYLKDMIYKEKDNIRSSSTVEVNDLNKQLISIDSRVSRLMDLYLEGEMPKREYCKNKEKLIENKHKIQQKINMFESGHSLWLEQLEHFINGLDKVKNYIETDNLSDKKNFLKNIGSNIILDFKIVNRKLKNQNGGGAGLEQTAAPEPDSGLCFGGGLQKKTVKANPENTDSTGLPPVFPKTCSPVKGGGKKKTPEMQIQIQYKKLWAVLAATEAKTRNAVAILGNENRFCSVWRP